MESTEPAKSMPKLFGVIVSLVSFERRPTRVFGAFGADRPHPNPHRPPLRGGRAALEEAEGLLRSWGGPRWVAR